MELKASETEKNLLTGFAGESQARNKYSYFASKAKKEGYVQISAIFEETSNQEKEHAKRLFKFLEGGEVQVSASFPAGVIGTTVENPEIATVFRSIAVAEKRHEDRYVALAENIANGRVFKREQPTRWICRNCGYVHEGLEAPKVCAACAHPQAHFELEAVNY